MPEEGSYRHISTELFALLFLNIDMTINAGVPSHRIICNDRNPGAFISPFLDSFIFPYNTNADVEGVGWYFATDNLYNVKSSTPTRYIKLYGAANSLEPDNFLIEPITIEGSANEKEYLRNRLNLTYASFNDVNRCYEDHYELTAPPPFDSISIELLNHAIDPGIHFLSLSGHGNWWGCCGADWQYSTFKNRNAYFIGFANSCLTSRPDETNGSVGLTSLGRKIIIATEGGAIGYTGNTRVGWVNIGHYYERSFWSKLACFARPAQASCLRLRDDNGREFWTTYAQNYYGDPELPAYTIMPDEIAAIHPLTYRAGDSITINVRKSGTGAIVENAQVTIMGGWVNSKQRPVLFQTKRTNNLGNAGFIIPNGIPMDLDIITVTVTIINAQPYQGKINRR